MYVTSGIPEMRSHALISTSTKHYRFLIIAVSLWEFMKASMPDESMKTFIIGKDNEIYQKSVVEFSRSKLTKASARPVSLLTNGGPIRSGYCLQKMRSRLFF